MRKAVKILAVVLLGYLVYACTHGPEEKDPEDRFSAPEKIQMVLEVDSSGPSAKISYHTLEVRDDPRRGYVETPYKKVVLSSGLSVTASSDREDEEVTCKITNGFSGEVLDRSGPSRVATCDYSTF